MRGACAGIVALAVAQVASGFAFTGNSLAAGRVAARGASSALTMKKGGEKGEKKNTHVRPKKFKISPKAQILADGVIEMNVKTGQITKDAPKEVKNQAKPGSVEVGTMELYCKAGPDSKSLGDCPFTHYAHMVLRYKGLPVTLVPCAPDAKPDWLVEDHEGKMPCLVHDGEAYTESSEIVRYIEYFFPEPTLSPQGASAQMAEAMEATSGLFPLMARCVKNLDAAQDAEMVRAIESELKGVDALLRKNGGPFLCGKDLTLADCSFAPKLYHTKTALAQFKNTIINPDFAALHKYMDTIFAHPAFVESSYPPDVVVWGWNSARGTSAK
ncbi:GSH-dependent dehydroascorbate reductase, monomeric enzymes catalyzing the reduction of DHA into asc [Tribonema minus]|uniref:glutathione dehydrogenase (ascorbate) n=1 Tax=Tribonema minus TaxID=303371 RepID=A0A835ZA14_9STRA|nr:GSH-dependent dehydroascorbate reductase, monomeric enzymes catalyzing the reduction of DHA into asc [Tribonema minus]